MVHRHIYFLSCLLSEKSEYNIFHISDDSEKPKTGFYLPKDCCISMDIGRVEAISQHPSQSIVQQSQDTELTVTPNRI